MTFLVDTVALSALFDSSRQPAVAAWLTARAPHLYTSILSFGEIERGIAKELVNDPPFGLRLSRWSSEAQQAWAARTLPMGIPEALQWGKLSQRLRRKDPDLMIAATALVHDLTVVTRNVAQFERTGVRVINPWAETSA